MKLVGKTFSRRPWEASDNGLIKHVDGVHVEQAEERGFYLCLHTSKGFLNQQEIACDSEDGFYWEALILENFSVSGVQNGEAIYITDGRLKGARPSVVIQNGEVKGLNNSNLATLSYLNLTSLSISQIKGEGSIMIHSCEVASLVVKNCKNLKFQCEGSRIGKIEFWQCKDCTVIGTESIPTVHENLPVEGMQASLSCNVLIQGTLYGFDIAGIKLLPRKSK